MNLQLVGLPKKRATMRARRALIKNNLVAARGAGYDAGNGEGACGITGFRRPMTDTTHNHRIRRAGFEDVEAIFDLVKRFPRELLARPIGDIVQNIDRFLVCEDEKGTIVGTVSWQILPEIGKPREPSVEIKSLAVDSDWRGRGIGTSLVREAVRQITRLHPAQCVVLTFTPAFFTRLGFAEVPKASLMHKLYAGCINCTKYDSPFTCPEVAMALNADPKESV